MFFPKGVNVERKRMILEMLFQRSHDIILLNDSWLTNIQMCSMQPSIHENDSPVTVSVNHLASYIFLLEIRD